MAQQIESKKYVFAIQDDGNEVVYKKLPDSSLEPIWDKWSYEASIGNVAPTDPISDISTIPPTPISDPTLIMSGANPIGMSYWRNINNHAGQDVLQVLLSIEDKLFIFTIDKKSLITLISAL